MSQVGNIEAENIEDWETTKAGFPIKRIILRNGALTASIITYGAVLQDLRFAGHAPPLVLGFNRLEPYENNSAYIGSTVGRCANRVSHGVCTIMGVQYTLDRQEGALHHLHGGPYGFNTRCWEIAAVSGHSVTLTLMSADGDAGYPGNLAAQCVYRLTGDNALSIELSAQTDAPTVCNLVNHSYFNLEDGGVSNINLHGLRLDAERYLVADAMNVPTGEIADVRQTEFDFRALRPVGNFKNYDHNFCLADAQRALMPVARLSAPSSGMEMDVLTTEPGIQLYGGGYLAIEDHGLDGIAYAQGSGICLETQIWPDAINHSSFPNVVLMPGKTQKQKTCYRFTKII